MSENEDDKIALPTIHLNGTGRDSLREENQRALDSIRLAMAHFQGITCHGRDYYPQGDAMLYKAQRERSAHFQKLEEVLAFLEAHQEHLYS